MAQPANTFATNDMVGIREDLSDQIYNVSPVDVPFSSSVRHIEATSTKHEWQTQSLAAAANNAVIEGDDATTDAGNATTRLYNYTQISDKVARVTGTGRSVNTAGRGDELDHQMMLKAKELKRDIEKVALDNKPWVVGNDSTARQCAGVPAWIVTNISEAGDATTATGDGSDAHTDGTARAFTETILKDVVKLCFDEGGNPDCLMTGTFNRQVISSFSTNRSNIQRAEDPKLHATFEIYESDFGELKIIPNRFMEARTALALEMDNWALAFLPGRNMSTEDLAKTGDTDRRQILSEYTVEAGQEKSSGAAYDLTTS